MSSSDILDPAALISLLPTLLPSSSKSLASPQDAISALIHTALTVLAFRLISVDDDDSASLTANFLPPQWNKGGPGHYTFKYKHDQSSLDFVIKISKLGPRTVVNAIAFQVSTHTPLLPTYKSECQQQSDKVATLDFSTDDFTSPSFFPHDFDAANGQPLVHGFISSTRVKDFMSQLKLNIIQKLMPSLQKEGYMEEISGSSSSASNNPPPPRPVNPPYTPYQPPRPTRPARNPLEIGRRDLDPFPINPFAPPSLFPPGSGDGMFVGPDHPIFRVNRDRETNQGPWGGDGFLPPLGAPPGARFDPVGPDFFPDRSGLGPLGGGRGGRSGGGNIQGPDNDEFMPPGSVSCLTLFSYPRLIDDDAG